MTPRTDTSQIDKIHHVGRSKLKLLIEQDVTVVGENVFKKQFREKVFFQV